MMQRAGTRAFYGALMIAWALLFAAGQSVAEAAVSRGTDKQLQSGTTNEGGGTTTSTAFRQRGAIGEAVSGTRISSSRFQIIPGSLGSSFASVTTPPVSDLTLTVLYAKTEPLGVNISQKTWQRDRDPIFYWEPPSNGPDVAGYSYAIDAAPDGTIDTTATSFNVATSSLGALTDGKHTFSVKAINTAGNSGPPISFEIWVDTTAPQVTAYTPTPGALLNVPRPSISATMSDAGSGIDASSIQLLVNGTAVSIQWNSATGVMTSTGGDWREGSNRLELHVADTVGNAPSPVIWSVTIDTLPPTGTILINGGALTTTSVYVTLGLSASDATSGVAKMLISNETVAGYVEESYAPLRALWRLNPVRGRQSVYVKFVDAAGNISDPVSSTIDLALLSPETIITSGPAGITPDHTATFTFLCPEGDCVFSYAFDGDPWSAWSTASSASKANLAAGNHYFRVKAAKEANGITGIQPDEEDPSPAERTWIVGVELPVMAIPKGSAIKLWRLE